MEDHFTINFELLIREMLSEYECVVIPGFGGFVTYTESASIVSDKNLILPPYKRLSFNINLNKNDGLLAHETVLKCGLTYEQALVSIQDLANRWITDLEKNKFLELNSLGSFRKSKDGNVLYEQAGEENYLLAAYGLSPVHAQAIEKDGISGKLKKELVQRKSTPNFNKKIRKYTIAGSLGLVLTALVVWSGLNLGLIEQKASELNLLFWRNSSEITNEQKKPAKVEVRSPEIKVESSIDSLADSLAEASVNELIEIPEKEKQVSTEVQEIIHEGKYIIVAGCFQSLENAQNFVDALKKMGYNAHLAGNSDNGLHRVAYDSFPDKESANVALSNIRLEHNSSAWITQIH